MATYSFLNVVAAMFGPGGSVNLGVGAATDKEGITVEFLEDAGKLTVGSDGAGMQSLLANKSAKITVRLLKTSPTNALLTAMYNLQRTAALLWGQNVITLTDIARGDAYTASEVAFVKHPKNDYKEEGGVLEWEFIAVKCDPILGVGF